MRKRSIRKLFTAMATVVAMLALAGCGGGGATGYDTETPVGEQTGMTIQGIDPGAGIMELARNALADYGLEDAGWSLQEASDAAMMAELDAAYNKEEAIIITGWTPHWMFEAYDLKYLEDPEGSFGEDDEIRTLIRLGLQEDDPNAVTFLDRFFWEASDMEKVMNDTRDSDSETAAAAWVEENSDRIDEWVDGLEEMSGETLRIAYVAWDSEIATTHVVKAILEERLSYTVELVQLDAGPMYAALAQGDVDAMVSAWLPTTHQTQYAAFEGEFIDLGANLEGTKLGLVVPTYMENVNSIEDLLAA